MKARARARVRQPGEGGALLQPAAARAVVGVRQGCADVALRFATDVSGRRPEARARETDFQKTIARCASNLEPRLEPRSGRSRASRENESRLEPRGRSDESSSDESEADAWWTAPFGAVAAKKVRVLDAVSERKKRAKARLRSPGVPPGDLGVAIDRTRPRPSGARGVIKWAKPKPAVPRGPNRSEAGARLGAEGPSAGTPRRGGTGSAWPRRSGGAPPRRRRMGTQTRRIARRGTRRAIRYRPSRRRALCVVAAAC